MQQLGVGGGEGLEVSEKIRGHIHVLLFSPLGVVPSCKKK